MQWDFVVAVIVAIPVIAFPALLVWYLAFGGTVAWYKEKRRRQQIAENEAV